MELRTSATWLIAAERPEHTGGSSSRRAPAVSRRICDLEDEISSAVYPDTGVVRPPLLGERFLVKARRAITNIEHAKADIGMAGRAAEAGTVRVGLVSSFAIGFLAELFRTYEAQHRGVRLSLVEGDPIDHVPVVPSASTRCRFFLREHR